MSNWTVIQKGDGFDCPHLRFEYQQGPAGNFRACPDCGRCEKEVQAALASNLEDALHCGG